MTTPEWTVLPGDCRHSMRLCLAPDSVDSIVTDPPYDLTSIVKRFGADNAAPAKVGQTGAYARASRGFMGMTWDGAGVAFDPDTWREAWRVLKPGGHLIAFGGSRTYHRLACAIEDAGFEIRDQIMWLYGSGFPKSHDVSKGIDKSRASRVFDELRTYLRAAIDQSGLSQRQIKAHLGYPLDSGVIGHWVGTSQPGIPGWNDWRRLKEIVPIDDRYDALIETVEREKIGEKRSAIANPNEAARHTLGAGSAVTVDITAPATDAARQWEGWGTALKPAHEPIVLARKPLVGTVAGNVLAHGTGAINIDGCRIEGIKPQVTQGINGNPSSFNITSERRVSGDPNEGRFPANVMHDGSDEVLAGFPETKSGRLTADNQRNGGFSGTVNCYGTAETGGSNHYEPDSGSAARFFANFQMDDAEWLDQSLQLDSANIADGRLSLQNLFDGFAHGPAAIWACPGAKVSLNIQIPPSMNATLTESRQIAETLIGAIQHTVSAFWQESPPERLSLLLNNVQFVAEAGPTGIILTIPALSISSGFVGLVIFSITPMNWEAGAKDSGQFTASFKYCAKASKADREEGLSGLPLVAAGMVSETSGQHITRREEGYEPPKRANHHPTVKPTALMRYLCRLITPPGGTVLDPFAGSGSTGKAALLEGFSFIGCEMTPEYIPIAEARLAHALAQHQESQP